MNYDTVSLRRLLRWTSFQGRKVSMTIPPAGAGVARAAGTA
jgi:hypothetical protein